MVSRMGCELATATLKFVAAAATLIRSTTSQNHRKCSALMASTTATVDCRWAIQTARDKNRCFVEWLELLPVCHQSRECGVQFLIKQL